MVVDDEYHSLVELLDKQASVSSDTPFITYLQEGVPASLTFAELRAKAAANIRCLRSMLPSGARVLLALNDPLEFVEAFFSCVYAGMIPVPVQAPRRKASLQPLAAITRASSAELVIGDTELTPDFTARAVLDPVLASARFLSIDAIRGSPTDSDVPPACGRDTVALLQFTSGSTSAPKGVVVTHGNLLHNQALVRACFGHSSQTRFAGWLPLYHDMGLIGNVLQPLFLGITCILMSPMAFMERPSRLLRAISDYRATTCGMPNFGYAHCIQRVRDEEIVGVDLSSWDVAYNGSEPVRADTMERFVSRFCSYGFRRQAFYPCYGLAEATLFVAGSAKGEGWTEKHVDTASLERHEVTPPSAGPVARLVSSGYVNAFQTLKIVDPDRHEECQPGRVGEIWLAGGSVARGYWGDAERTRESFHAFLADGAGPFFRTGDTGFVDKGRLYVTGRLKDLIIVRGKNHYPQDIEASLGDRCPAFVPDGTAALALSNDSDERLVIVQEIRREYVRRPDSSGWRFLIVDTIAKQHQLSVFDVKFVLPRTIPRTSSGKIQRHKCRALYLSGTLHLIDDKQTAPAPDASTQVA